jgi:hypothetical protein
MSLIEWERRGKGTGRALDDVTLVLGRRRWMEIWRGVVVTFRMCVGNEYESG